MTKSSSAICALCAAAMLSAASARGAATLTTLVSLDGMAEQFPTAGVALDAAGDLFGATEFGGPYGAGSVYEVAAGTRTVTTLSTFNGASGSQPFATPTLDAAGNLYGTTLAGGPTDVNRNGNGVVYEVSAGTHALSTVLAFNGSNGAAPAGTLLADAAVNLYGTTEGGGLTSSTGTAFELVAGTHVPVTLATFAHPAGTRRPAAWSGTRPATCSGPRPCRVRTITGRCMRFLLGRGRSTRWSPSTAPMAARPPLGR